MNPPRTLTAHGKEWYRLEPEDVIVKGDGRLEKCGTFYSSTSSHGKTASVAISMYDFVIAYYRPVADRPSPEQIWLGEWEDA